MGYYTGSATAIVAIVQVFVVEDSFEILLDILEVFRGLVISKYIIIGSQQTQINDTFQEQPCFATFGHTFIAVLKIIVGRNC